MLYLFPSLKVLNNYRRISLSILYRSCSFILFIHHRFSTRKWAQIKPTFCMASILFYSWQVWRSNILNDLLAAKMRLFIEWPFCRSINEDVYLFKFVISYLKRGSQVSLSFNNLILGFPHIDFLPIIFRTSHFLKGSFQYFCRFTYLWDPSYWHKLKAKFI